ncbi:hypothetical protein OIU83_11295 [Flavobacterium sp. LS1R49]|uniref:Peptidase S74 domain-containing protein n=1 Tax=Flavobacterium shii TaxID=2987687 RepID=A0A9X3C4M7_9FLAO|nr:hypothetical protein [Flavobacterium shii]MCV9928244.1 hypothetical protein [Flavobacterium shii]
MKKRIFTGLLILSNLLLANAQNTTFNEVAIGLSVPDWGVNIKTNFPGLTGSWNRGFFISNETGLQHLFSIGANGNSVNGISSFTSGFIGTDWDNQFMSFLPNGNIGIGTNNPIEKLNINGGTGDGASFDARMALTKISSTGNILTAKIVLNDADTSFGNLNFKVKTTASKSELEEFYTNALTIKGINAYVGIGTNNPIEKFNINGGIGDGSSFDARMALTKVSSTGNVQSAKIVLSDVDTDFGNLTFKVKTTASKSEIDRFYSDALTIKGSNAYIGVGTNTPIEKLNINGGTGDGTTFDARMALTRVSSTGNVQSAKIVLSDADTNFGNLTFKVKTTASRSEIESFYTDALTIKGSNANVGIGTTNPDEKLTVNGKIHAKEVRIDLLDPMTKVPDYVFANDYKLKSLQEVEEFIKQNSHLPEIPSAKEIEKNGLMLAEMNMSLLKKIEELTLYSIAQEKKINSQAQEIEALKDLALRVTKIESELTHINNK